jgi:alpha-tubulin suppressor-like RCC1 family protein
MYGWGFALPGQPVNSVRHSPVHLPALDALRTIGCGDYICYGATARGAVRTWRQDNTGQVRIRRMSSLSHVVQLAGTSSSGYALTGGGLVWSWGGNAYGQLGDGTTQGHPYPRKIARFGNVVGIATCRGGGNGQDSVYAWKKNGSLWAWGDNEFGELGDGTTRDRHRPRQVLHVTDVVSVACGTGYGTYAVQGNGTVWAWGYFDGGPHAPRKIAGMTGFKAVTGSDAECYALRADGTVWRPGTAWISSAGTAPKRVRGLSRIAAVSSTGYSNADAGAGTTAFALRKDGTVWAWGDAGTFGDGTAHTTSGPVQVGRFHHAIAVFGGATDSAYALIG